MTNQLTELQIIMARLERVEEQNRNLKRIVVVLLVTASAVALMGQGRPKRTVEAEEFVLKDAVGRVRARLEMESTDRPTLSLLDARGVPLISIMAGETPSLTLSKYGGQQVQLGSFGSDLFGLALYRKDNASPFGGLQAAVGVFKGSPGFELYNGVGQAVGLDLDFGDPKLSLRDSSGESSTIYSSSILLLGKDGKRLWSAP